MREVNLGGFMLGSRGRAVEGSRGGHATSRPGPAQQPSNPETEPPYSRYLYPSPYTVSIRSKALSTSSNLRRRRLMWLSMVRSLT